MTSSGYEIRCAGCGRLIAGSTGVGRSAQHCSAGCRQRAYRARLRQRLEAAGPITSRDVIDRQVTLPASAECEGLQHEFEEAQARITHTVRLDREGFPGWSLTLPEGRWSWQLRLHGEVVGSVSKITSVTGSSVRGWNASLGLTVVALGMPTRGVAAACAIDSHRRAERLQKRGARTALLPISP